MKERNLQRAISILESAKELHPSLADMCIHAGYAEPGYDDCAVVVGNWNGRYASRLGNIFEKLGLEIEWSDEWGECEDCYKIVRTEPSGFYWTPAYFLGESGTFVCKSCFNGSMSSILFKEACDHKEVYIPWELEEEDFVCVAGTRVPEGVEEVYQLLDDLGIRYYFTQRSGEVYLIWADADEWASVETD